MSRLDFSASDLNLPANREKTRRASISEVLGFYSSADFIELGAAFGVFEEEVRGMISFFNIRSGVIERMIEVSCLSTEAKTRYLAKFVDRLKAVAQ